MTERIFCFGDSNTWGYAPGDLMMPRYPRETRWPGFGVHTDYPARDDRYALFVNSVLQDGEIRMIFRPLQVP